MFFLPIIGAIAAKTIAATIAATATTVVVSKAASDAYDAIVHPKKD